MGVLPSIAATLLALSVAGGAWAAEKTVTLALDGMDCVSCPYIVKQTLATVPGVAKVDVSYAKKTAVVTFDDAKTTIAALASASAKAGFPARPAQ